ncbi:MAG: aquaporin [Bacteroidetes bacterium]|nr:aquaporin [Bacteroidota bacterium]MBX7045376.1 aquaporin [Ignavibacteria bacterium]
MNKYLTEFIGTFFLILTIGLSVFANSVIAPIAIGSALMVMIYMGGNISGGHYNPAVSLGVFMRGKMEAKDLIAYWIFQLLGGIIAAFVIFTFTNKALAVAPGAGVESWKAVVAEVLGTFALVSVVLNVATTKKAAGNSYFGLAIGFTVAAMAVALGPISGGAFNPAVALGPQIVDAIKGGSSLSNCWIYLVGCFAGGALAAIVFRICNPDEFAG